MGKENDELWQFACQDMGPSGAQLAILNLSCFTLFYWIQPRGAA